jgi:tellurite resistance protein
MGTNPAIAKRLPLNELEALVEVVFLGASADGELSAEEHEVFAHTVRQLADERIGTRLGELVGRFKRALQSSGREARLRALKAELPKPSARRLALELAIQVAAVDGSIRGSERELILDTAEALGIDRSLAASLVQRFER